MLTDINNDPLFSKMWQTKGSRFKAYYRLQRKHHLSLFAISILSMYLTAISVLLLSPSLYNLRISEDLLSSLSVMAALFVVVLSHHENSKNYLVRADHMHACALDIGEIYNELQAKLQLAIDQQKSDQDIYDLKKDYIAGYNRIVTKYPINHCDTDFQLFCADNPKTFKEYQDAPGKIAKLKLLCWWSDSWLYIACIVIPPIIFVLGALTASVPDLWEYEYIFGY